MAYDCRREVLGAKGRISPPEPATPAPLCLSPGVPTTDLWVAQESFYSLSLCFLICTMGLIITTSQRKLLPVPGNFVGDSPREETVLQPLFSSPHHSEDV